MQSISREWLQNQTCLSVKYKSNFWDKATAPHYLLFCKTWNSSVQIFSIFIHVSKKKRKRKSIILYIVVLLLKNTLWDGSAAMSSYTLLLYSFCCCLSFFLPDEDTKCQNRSFVFFSLFVVHWWVHFLSSFPHTLYMEKTSSRNCLNVKIWSFCNVSVNLTHNAAHHMWCHLFVPAQAGSQLHTFGLSYVQNC